MRRFLRLFLRRLDQEQSHPAGPILMGHLFQDAGSRIWLNSVAFWKKRRLLIPAATPVTQKIGDYYASCTDEKAIDAKGAGPLQADAGPDRQVKSKAELADVATAMARRQRALPLRSTQDFRDASQVIAEADQGGLGLPDRDYYTKGRCEIGGAAQSIRRARAENVRTAGRQARYSRSAEAQTVMRIETALAKGSHDAGRTPRSESAGSQDGQRRALKSSLLNFSGRSISAKVGLPTLPSLNVASPNFFKTLNEELKRKALRTGKLISAGIWCTPTPSLSVAVLERELRVLRKDAAGQEQLKPRWKRCTENIDDYLGEALGQAYVEKYFSPEAKQQALKMVKEIEAAMEQDIKRCRGCRRQPSSRRSVKLQGMANKIGYPDKWRDYSKLDDRARRRTRQRRACAAI